MTTEVVKILTHDELEKLMQDSAKKGDWKGVREAAKQLEAVEKAQAQVEKDAKLKALIGITLKVSEAIQKAVAKFTDAGQLDVADGVWFAYDFGGKIETGINPSCRLIKTAPRKAGTGSGSGSYIARPEKSSDLLAQVGSQVMFKEDTEVTIDKVAQIMPAGMTLKEAYEFSNNGGWRNRVRMALLKAAGLV